MQKAVIADGKVINLIQYEEKTGIQGLRLRNDQQLYDASLYDVRIGDDFADGAFTRNGEAVAYLGENAPTYGEALDALETLGVSVNG